MPSANPYKPAPEVTRAERYHPMKKLYRYTGTISCFSYRRNNPNALPFVTLDLHDMSDDDKAPSASKPSAALPIISTASKERTQRSAIFRRAGIMTSCCSCTASKSPARNPVSPQRSSLSTTPSTPKLPFSAQRTTSKPASRSLWTTSSEMTGTPSTPKTNIATHHAARGSIDSPMNNKERPKRGRSSFHTDEAMTQHAYFGLILQENNLQKC